jgi:hypothetical protein
LRRNSRLTVDGLRCSSADYALPLDGEFAAAEWRRTASSDGGSSLTCAPVRIPCLTSGFIRWQALGDVGCLRLCDGPETAQGGPDPVTLTVAGARLPLVRAVPGGFFAILRLYSPLQPFFDKTWRPSEIEPT